MKFSLSSVLLFALATESTVASSWFGGATKAAYNKWHETELERWLSDNNVPYPTPADRKDLENLVKNNWNEKVATPYKDWDTPQLQSYLKSKGVDSKKAADTNKNNLVSSVKSYWTDGADSASESYHSVKDWIFDSWTDSQLKSFLDKNDIPAPQPRKRDTMIAAARSNYESIAKKLGQSFHYPGDWLYETWSESDLKEFLDERGVPVPQPSTRDKLIASVRRNSRLASTNLKDTAASASKSAQAAKESLGNALLDSWSDSQIKEWADKNGIKVPQGSKRNELLALARKHRNALTGDNVASSVSSAFGAATTKANNQFAQATDDVQLKGEDAFNQAVGTWSDSRLKAFLDARGVPVPQGGKKDELMKQVRLNKHKASTGWSAWTFDTWTVDNLKKYLSSSNDKAVQKAASKAGATRDDLLKQAQDSYSSASKSGGSNYASVTSYLAASTDAVKESTFDTWSDSELKSYLDSYGVKNYQGSNTNELKAMARRNAQYFRHGTNTPGAGIFASLQNGAQWVLDQLKIGAASGRKEAEYQGQKGADHVKEAGTAATNRAGEAGQKASDKVKEEL
ncbi:MAG: hypothetical protein ASARMPREDX12_003789 [Alectoria sarmentosa]|nr:MAG: hypothetical protein ASARMPREDX12_003789 [Alectoria sarmentosa]CAD6571935.1 MAG: hypothetical protein ASARMPRED_004923 [Alectoria sarmentosa]